MQPHRWQPTRLPRPWDSPGKNTGVGCHFLLQCVEVKSESEVTQSCLTPSDPMDCSLSGSSIHGIFQARVLEWGAITFSVRQCYLCTNSYRHSHKFSFAWPFKATYQCYTLRALDCLMALYNCPLIIASDQDNHFTGKEFQEWAHRWGIRWIFHVLYNPQAAGMIE